GASTLAVAPIVKANSAGNRTEVGDIMFSNAANWFFDPTERLDEEFSFTQTLFRDLDGATQGALFKLSDGTPPPELEVGYVGSATAGSGAQKRSDLLTTALHEIGHHLGVTNQFAAAKDEWSDNDYDLPGSLMRGGTAAARSNDGFGHLAGPSQLLLQPGLNAGTRILPSATDVFSAVAVSGWPAVGLKRQDFIAASGGNTWSAANWMGNYYPGETTDAYIRSRDFNPTVELVRNSTARNLFVGEDDNLSTNAYTLTVGETLEADGFNTDVYVNPGGQVIADQVLVKNGADLRNYGGHIVASGLTVQKSSALVGRTSTATVGVSESFVNDGTVIAQSGQLLIGGAATIWDLDGENDGGSLNATSGDIGFQMISPLHDPISGSVTVGAGHILASSQPFVFDSGARIYLHGGSTAGDAAKLNVNTTLVGNNAVMNVDGLAQVNAPFNMLAATVNLDAQAELELGYDAILTGSSFNMGAGATAAFEASTRITDSSFGASGAGSVKFNGETELYGGTVTVGGVVHQNGDVTVTLPTTIHGPGTWDMDGDDGNTVWFVNNNLTLNTARLENGANQRFDGRIELGGSGTTLSVSTGSPWTMDGRLSLQDGTAVSGSSQMSVTGELYAGSGDIDAPVAFEANSSVVV
ncbi:MAG: hypothetical protein KDA37_16900, partial [Planctomycetales bacterium]|nr:hypothetical protein [Planctomycetales bacterium]